MNDNMRQATDDKKAQESKNKRGEKTDL